MVLLDSTAHILFSQQFSQLIYYIRCSPLIQGLPASEWVELRMYESLRSGGQRLCWALISVISLVDCVFNKHIFSALYLNYTTFSVLWFFTRSARQVMKSLVWVTIEQSFAHSSVMTRAHPFVKPWEHTLDKWTDYHFKKVNIYIIFFKVLVLTIHM